MGVYEDLEGSVGIRAKPRPCKAGGNVKWNKKNDATLVPCDAQGTKKKDLLLSSKKNQGTYLATQRLPSNHNNGNDNVPSHR